MLSRELRRLSAVIPLAIAFATPAVAQKGDDLKTEIKRLRGDIATQQRKLAEQQKIIDEQQRRLQLLEMRFSESAAVLGATRGAGLPPDQGRPATAQAPAAPGPVASGPIAQAPEPVGQAPEARPPQRPELPERPDIGGVLNPAGRLTVEPSFEYANSQLNRFFFSGAQIVDTVFIGGLDATNAKRNTLTAALTGRYGITNRLQADLRVPYVYRADRDAEGVNTDVLSRSIYGSGLGDIEAGFHYQLNSGTNGGSVYVANLRVKSDTGEGPFDVPFNVIGQQQRLPTGSGFWAVEPSVTVLYPADPVVLFANLGYLFNFEKDVNKQIGGHTFGHVSPGDSLRGSFGLGIGLNERISLSLGYQHDWVQSTESVIDGIKTSSEELQVGQFLVGASYVFSPNYSANINVAVGATRDAPDVRLLLSVPISFDVFR